MGDGKKMEDGKKSEDSDRQECIHERLKQFDIKLKK